MVSQREAISYITAIRRVQDLEHPGHQHTIPEWLIIMRRQLQKAEDAWYAGDEGRAFDRVAHVAACGLAALEQTGERAE